MRILVVHNAYQLRGGEDRVVELEAALLRSAGHEVSVEVIRNSDIRSTADKVTAALRTPYDHRRASWIGRLVGEFRAEVVHIHNFFPLLTPAVHVGAAAAGAAVVQTLHNYRLLCSSALFLRGGHVCEKCLGGNNVWGIVHRCYRGSLGGSAALALMQLRTRSADWLSSVDRFVALSEFGRGKFIAGGLPPDRIVTKPNFSPDAGDPGAANRSGALFVGRLSEEKGVRGLLEAWRRLPHIHLTIAGDGPLMESLQSEAPSNVTFLGAVTPARVAELMRASSCLVIPSIWYEGFPMTVVEALSHGLPVLASRIGALEEIVRPGENGAHFEPRSPIALADTVETAFKDVSGLEALSVGARQTFEARYSPARNLAQIEEIYRNAIAASAKRLSGTN